MTMRFELFQVNDSHRDLRFRSIEGNTVSKCAYKSVYSGLIRAEGSVASILEDLYYKFNMDHPADFRGHSMSVSDVVVLDDAAYFCDDFGFKRVAFA